jgi:hypothetical protein
VSKHVNNGNCLKCEEILNLFPNFHPGMRSWFKALQKAHTDAHISCAGRGKADQEEYYKRKVSNAKWGQSAHNYNCALDFFRLTLGRLSYDRPWFEAVVQKAVEANNADCSSYFNITWYGVKGSPYYELPHCEVSNWKTLGLPLVENS